jgi:hypothetical protein
MPLVGWILIIMALFSVGGVLFVVVREKPEPEDHAAAAQPNTIAAQSGATTYGKSSEPNATTVAEVAGTQMTSPSPIIDAEAKRQAEENRG